jgi:DNA-binding transcriptional LysR family regulator
MDRFDELTAFVTVADERSFVASARRLRRSPAAVTRAVASLEARLGSRLFTRTTRAVVLSEAGRRHLDPCRQILREFTALQADAAREQGEPSGALTVTASIVFGRLHVLPIVHDFLRRYPSVDVRMILADEVRSLVDEGIDVGIRIAHLPDSTLQALRVGSVRRAVYASPAYLAAHGEPRVPADLARHTCVAFGGTTPAPDRWVFGSGKRTTAVALAPRLAINMAEAAIDSATAGLGLTCVLSYMVDHLVAAGLLRPVLRAFEPPPIPIHVVYPAGRHLPQRTRRFIDHAATALREKFTSPGSRRG